MARVQQPDVLRCSREGSMGVYGRSYALDSGLTCSDPKGPTPLACNSAQGPLSPLLYIKSAEKSSEPCSISEAEGGEHFTSHRDLQHLHFNLFFFTFKLAIC